MQYDTEYNVLGVHTVGWTIAYCKYFLVHCTSLCVWHRVYNCAILRSWYSTSTWYAYVQYTYLAEGSRRTGTVHYIHDPKDFWCQKAEIQSREQWSNMCLQLLGSVFANTASYCIMHTMIPGMSSYILGVRSNLQWAHVHPELQVLPEWGEERKWQVIASVFQISAIQSRRKSKKNACFAIQRNRVNVVKLFN